MLARCLRQRFRATSVGMSSKLSEARIESQAALLDEARTFTFMLTEQAIRWPRADLDVMARQCVHMAELSARPMSTCQLSPIAGKFQASLCISSSSMTSAWHRRAVLRSIVLARPKDISYHLSLFNYFLSHALTGEDATRFLESVADEFIQERDSGFMRCMLKLAPITTSSKLTATDSRNLVASSPVRHG